MTPGFEFIVDSTGNSSQYSPEFPSSGNPYRDLLSPKYKQTTLKLWAIWFCKSFTYYGNVLLTSKIFGNHSVDEGGGDGFHDFDFSKVIISASSEFFATTLLIFLVSRLGRVPIGRYAYFSGGVFLLLFCLTQHVIFGVAAR
jgi:hypothetical protein